MQAEDTEREDRPQIVFILSPQKGSHAHDSPLYFHRIRKNPLAGLSPTHISGPMRCRLHAGAFVAGFYLFTLLQYHIMKPLGDTTSHKVQVLHFRKPRKQQ